MTSFSHWGMFPNRIDELHALIGPHWTRAAVAEQFGARSSSYKVTIVGNTPTTGGKLSEQNWQDWLKSIPDPVEPERA